MLTQVTDINGARDGYTNCGNAGVDRAFGLVGGQTNKAYGTMRGALAGPFTAMAKVQRDYVVGSGYNALRQKGPFQGIFTLRQEPGSSVAGGGARRRLAQAAAAGSPAQEAGYGWSLLAVGSEFAFELRTEGQARPITYFSGVPAEALRRGQSRTSRGCPLKPSGEQSNMHRRSQSQSVTVCIVGLRWCVPTACCMSPNQVVPRVGELRRAEREHVCGRRLHQRPLRRRLRQNAAILVQLQPGVHAWVQR
eukprot:1184436-Prorocentrum_minimum.AAC.3